MEDFEHDVTLRIAQGLDFILRVGEAHPMEVLSDCLYSYRISKTSGTIPNSSALDRR